LDVTPKETKSAPIVGMHI